MRPRSGCLLLAAAFAAAPAAGAEPAGARAFMARLIADQTGGRADIRSKAFADLFTPPLRRLLRADMQGAEPGVLDYDPICQCQDDEGLRMTLVTLDGRGSTATAMVRNTFPADTITVTFSLALTPQGWRIADIAGPGAPSLRATLEDSTAR